MIIALVIKIFCGSEDKHNEENIDENVIIQRKREENSQNLKRFCKNKTMDLSKVRKCVGDLMETNDSNNMISEMIDPEKKEEYKEETIEVFTTAISGLSKESDDKNADLVCRKDNLFLHPNRTMIYKYVVEHIKEFETIHSDKRLNKVEVKEKVKMLMK